MKLQSVGLVFSLFLSLGFVAFSCSSGDTVNGGTGAGTGNTTGNGSGGTTGTGNSTGNGGTTGTGNSTGRGGTTGTGNTIGQGGTTGRGGTTGTGNTTGRGGTTGTGNTTGQGGTTGTGNTTGTGGTTGTVANCIMGGTAPPAAALITDFSDAVADTVNAGQIKYGGTSSTEVQGGTSEFADTTETKLTLAVTAGALSVSGSSKGSYTGVVLYMNGPECIDATAYTGVQFDISGSLGTCNLTFGFGFSEDNSASSDPNRGTCTVSGCYGPSVAVTATTGTVKVAFTGVSGGGPATDTGAMTVDKTKLTGVQWQLQSATATATCTASFTLDNVKFY